MFDSESVKIKSKLGDLQILRDNLYSKLLDMQRLSDEIMTSFDQLDDQKLPGSFSIDRCFAIEDEQISEQMQKADSFLWDMVLKESGIFNIVSSDLKDKLKEKYNFYSIEHKRKRNNDRTYDIEVPIFSSKDVSKVIDDIAANLPSIRSASLKEVFDKLNQAFYRRDKHDRSKNEQQSKLKIEKKMRFNYFSDLATNKYPSLHDWSRDYNSHGNPRIFGDLENAFRMIDNKQCFGIEDRVCTRMINFFLKTSYESAEFPLMFSTDYFQILLFKKGTVLLTFKDEHQRSLDLFNKYSTNGKTLA